MAITQDPVVITASDTKMIHSIKLVLIIAVTFLSSFILGFLTVKFAPIFKDKPVDGFFLTKSVNLAFPPELLQNPMFSNWTARVEGKVIDKRDQFLIISHIVKEYTATGSSTIREIYDGQTLQIVFIPSKTTFRPPIASLSALPVDSIITGNVEIYRTGNKWALIGNRFSIMQ